MLVLPEQSGIGWNEHEKLDLMCLGFLAQNMDRGTYLSGLRYNLCPEELCRKFLHHFLTGKNTRQTEEEVEMLFLLETVNKSNRTVSY